MATVYVEYVSKAKCVANEVLWTTDRICPVGCDHGALLNPDGSGRNLFPATVKDIEQEFRKTYSGDPIDTVIVIEV